MNNGARHIGGRSAGGFTLLEIVFVLGMIAMIVAWVTLSTTTVDTELKLREAAGSIESLVKRGRSIAVMQQRAYQVTISHGSVELAPQYYRGEAEEFDEDDETTAREDFEDITAVEETDPDVLYEIRRWRSDTWQEIDGDLEIKLVMDPVGLVEPVSIRCSVGKSWIIQELHPLTGGVNDEEMSIESE